MSQEYEGIPNSTKGIMFVVFVAVSLVTGNPWIAAGVLFIGAGAWVARDMIKKYRGRD